MNIDLTPLLAARSQIDKQLEALREQSSILGKRREALTNAIDVMRSTDAEVAGMKLPSQHKKRTSAGDVDLEVLENTILDILRHGKVAKPAILEELNKQQVVYTYASVKRILATSPKVLVTGLRESTRYGLSVEANHGR